MSKKVALVLASGGSRGLAHIGAIEVLQEHGFEITSVSGCSMGALVGGIFAAGGLNAFKEWMQTVDRPRVLSLMDFTLSTSGFMKGDRIIEELKEIIPDKRIEDLDIPFTAVATDIRHRCEVVFNSGSLYDAIRSSISMPSVFKPNRIGNMVLIDGGVVNPIPLDRVARTEGDILVAVDLNAPYEVKKKEKFPRLLESIREKIGSLTVDLNQAAPADTAEQAAPTSSAAPAGFEDDEDMGMVSIMNEASALMLQANSERSIALYPPDVLVRIAKNAYSTMEFFKYDEILHEGREKTIESLRAAHLL